MTKTKIKHLYDLMDACYFLGQEHRSTPKGDYLFTKTQKQNLIRAHLNLTEPVETGAGELPTIDTLTQWIIVVSTSPLPPKSLYNDAAKDLLDYLHGLLDSQKDSSTAEPINTNPQPTGKETPKPLTP